MKSLALNTAGSQMNLRCAADWHQAQTDRHTLAHKHTQNRPTEADINNRNYEER